MYTFKDVDLVATQPLHVSLRRIFGVGLIRAMYLCDLVGFSKSVRTENINQYNFLLLIFLLKQYYGTDVFLKRTRENRLKDFLAFKSYKAIRFFAGLPIRGQHTHNNAKTAKRTHFIVKRS